MISVCIPIHNFDCSELIRSLSRQRKGREDQLEIILMDDASNFNFQKKYQKLSSDCRFYQLKENVGRSKIRNMLAQKATHNFLLFIDGDSAVISDHFISDYIKILKAKPDLQVICGGSIYQESPPPKSFLLRWKYSRKREIKTFDKSKKQAYRSFTSNNFMINKKLFESIQFDERVSGYGHEDTLLGFRLKQLNIQILHLRNPVLNQNLDGNRLFLKKTEESLENLLRIDYFLDRNEEFRTLMPLLKFYCVLKQLKITFILRFLGKKILPFLKTNLEHKEPSLLFFDLYRLISLSVIDNKIKTKGF